MQPERPLPTRDAVLERLSRQRVRHTGLEMELQLTPRWRWRARRQLRTDLAYVAGTIEGLRLGLGVRYTAADGA